MTASRAESSKVFVDQQEINYRVRRSSRRRTVGITIDTAGNIELAAPPFVNIEMLDAAVRKKSAWILRKIQEQKSTRPTEIRKFVSGEVVGYMGESFELRLDNQFEEIQIADKWLNVPTPPGPQTKAALEIWMREQAAAYFPGAVARCGQMMGLFPSKVVISNARRRWGSCNSRGVVRINWRLIQASQDLQDYVIAHELTHLVHPNHSKHFWNHLRAAMPDYALRRKKLKLLGGELMW